MGTTTHPACSPTLLLMGSAWPHGDTTPRAGRRRGDRTPADALTCITPATSWAAVRPEMECAGQQGKAGSLANSLAAGPPASAGHLVGWSRLETLSGSEIQQSSSGTGRPGGSVPGGVTVPHAQLHPHNLRMNPVATAGPQTPFPVLGGSFKGASSIGPDMPLRGATRQLSGHQK